MMIEIMQFQPRFQHAVASVIVSIQREEFGIDITLEDQPDLQDIQNFYLHGSGNFWLAVFEDKVIGTIALLDIGGKQGALRKMFVKAPFRGAHYGVAKRLLTALLEQCKEKDVNEIFLGTTEKFIAAHRFYEKNGFHRIEKPDLPYKFPIMAVDTKFYWCDVSESGSHCRL
jgi:N-acetylglutamate synthase-like GNAT family acetyltransferase